MENEKYEVFARLDANGSFTKNDAEMLIRISVHDTSLTDEDIHKFYGKLYYIYSGGSGYISGDEIEFLAEKLYGYETVKKMDWCFWDIDF